MSRAATDEAAGTAPAPRHLALIPARGGSKRIPRKNLRPFAGRPMIGYAIAAARASGLFAHVAVSTDDDEIAAVACALGAEVPFRRPAHLADDHATTAAVMAHGVAVCTAAGWTFDAVCCIYPAVPLLQPQDLRDGLALLEAGGADFAFPVLPFPAPIQRALRRSPDGRTAPFDARHAQTRSQDLEPAFHDAGQFYWGRPAAWAAGGSLHLNARTLVLPGWRAVDIDTPDDWVRAEALFAVLSAQGPAGAAGPSGRS